LKGYTLRVATEEDLDTLVEHRRRMFEEMRHPTERELDAADRTYRAWARKRLRSGQLRCLLVSDRSGKVVAGGCVWLRDVQPAPGRPGGRMPYLMYMYTEPGSRRKGLASLIVKQSMEWARSQGYARMTLHASEVGREVYSKLGWERSWEMRADLSQPSVRVRTATAGRARS